MATIFVLAAGRVERHDWRDGRALFLDGSARVASDGWQIALVLFAVAPCAPRRLALVAAPGVDVVLAGRLLREGVTELRDRDHFLVGAHEVIVSLDELPEPVSADAPCAVCSESLAADGRRLYRCPRCGLQACTRCFTLAPRGVCLTPGCGAPAALDRALWAPAPTDFVGFEEVA